jgi:hypothetical protein
MLLSRILQQKLKFEKPNGDIVTDLTRSNFIFPRSTSTSGGITIVDEFEKMRPDLIANRMLGKQNLWDSLLKFNGISNPFSINAGDGLYVIPASNLEDSIKSPITYPDRGETSEINPDSLADNRILDPKTQKDQDRLKNLQKKVGEVLPPNINRRGVENAKQVDGKIIFGDSNTAAAGKVSSSISRDRIITALKGNNVGL